MLTLSSWSLMVPLRFITIINREAMKSKARTSDCRSKKLLGDSMRSWKQWRSRRKRIRINSQGRCRIQIRCLRLRKGWRGSITWNMYCTYKCRLNIKRKLKMLKDKNRIISINPTLVQKSQKNVHRWLKLRKEMTEKILGIN